LDFDEVVERTFSQPNIVILRHQSLNKGFLSCNPDFTFGDMAQHSAQPFQIET